jgi:hypothetical protein
MIRLPSPPSPLPHQPVRVYRDGVFAGFVELAIPIGDHLPRFDRD